MNRISSSAITFKSQMGNLDVHGFEHPHKHMWGVSGGINFHVFSPYKKISFLTGPTDARNMTVSARGGIYIDENVRSTDGDLWLNWTTNDLIVTEHSHVSAIYGDLILTSAKSNIKAYMPSSLNSATGSIYLDRSITVFRNPDGNATFGVRL